MSNLCLGLSEIFWLSILRQKKCVIEEKLYYIPVLQHAIFDLLVLIFYLYGAVEYLWYKKALSVHS